MLKGLDYENIGLRIWKQREWLKMTQVALANEMEISKPFLNEIEKGKRVFLLIT